MANHALPYHERRNLFFVIFDVTCPLGLSISSRGFDPICLRVFPRGDLIAQLYKFPPLFLKLWLSRYIRVYNVHILCTGLSNFWAVLLLISQLTFSPLTLLIILPVSSTFDLIETRKNRSKVPFQILKFIKPYIIVGFSFLINLFFNQKEIQTKAPKRNFIGNTQNCDYFMYEICPNLIL